MVAAEVRIGRGETATGDRATRIEIPEAPATGPAWEPTPDLETRRERRPILCSECGGETDVHGDTWWCPDCGLVF